MIQSNGQLGILNQAEKRVRDIGSLIFETPIQHDYEAGVEVRSLLPTERPEEMDGRLAVTDEDSRGVRYVKFWVDDAPGSPAEGRASSLGEEVVKPSLVITETGLEPESFSKPYFTKTTLMCLLQYFAVE